MVIFIRTSWFCCCANHSLFASLSGVASVASSAASTASLSWTGSPLNIQICDVTHERFSMIGETLPYCKSSRQHWQIFLILEHVWHISVRLYRAPLEGFQRNIVYGRSHILQVPACVCFTIRMYGESPKHGSQSAGNSEFSHPCKYRSDTMY